MVGNRYDNFYGYTGLFPIKPSTGDGSTPARDLRRVLAKLPNGAGSLFSKTRLVHGARLFVLSDVVYNGHPSRLEHLRHQYLVMSLTFDGELRDLLARVAEHSRDEWHEVFQHTWGHPETLTGKNIHAHVTACQVTTTFLYVDASADLEGTLRALAIQKEILTMVQEGQGAGVETRRRLVKEMAVRARSMPTVVPGTLTGGDRHGA